MGIGARRVGHKSASYNISVTIEQELRSTTSKLQRYCVLRNSKLGLAPRTHRRHRLRLQKETRCHTATIALRRVPSTPQGDAAEDHKGRT